MPGAMDKGLASSIWHPRNNGRSSHYFKKPLTTQPTPIASSNANSASTSTSMHTAVRVSNADPMVSNPLNHPTANGHSLAATDDISHAFYSPNGGSYQIDLNSALRRVPTPWAELARFRLIARRLDWKKTFLSQGYDAATNTYITDEQREEAELMFKLDFFDYYMLLERALVRLLGVFGIKVTRGFDQGLGDGSTGQKRGDRDGPEQSDHRFHANVLEAFDDPTNPLHEVLGGRGDVRLALSRAKELRNRWKNADDPGAALAVKLPYNSKINRPLKDYDLGWILVTILTGLEQGFLVAEQYVKEVRTLAAERGLNGIGAERANESQVEEWEFITDAMDWEAV